MRILILIILILGSATKLCAQGLNFDDAAYRNVPQKYAIEPTDSTGLPARVDLSHFAPSVLSQKEFNTCVGFSTAYYARTILEAERQRITDRTEIDALSFSPSFMYNAIKDSTDSNCTGGSELENALTYLRENGVAR